MSSDAVFIENFGQAFVENFLREIVTTQAQTTIALN